MPLQGGCVWYSLNLVCGGYVVGGANYDLVFSICMGSRFGDAECTRNGYGRAKAVP